MNPSIRMTTPPHPRATYRGDVTSDIVAGLHGATRPNNRQTGCRGPERPVIRAHPR